MNYNKYFIELKKKFKQELNSCKNPMILIKREIETIEKIISEDVLHQRITMQQIWGRGGGGTVKHQIIIPSVMDKNIFSSFRGNELSELFYEYLLSENINQQLEERINLRIENLINVSKDEFFNVAKNLAEYYTWLQGLNNPQQIQKSNKSALTLKQKMLALHYLEANLNQSDNTKTAVVLSQIFGFGEENARKTLSYLSAGKNKTRTKQNLQKVLELFENNGFTTSAKLVKKDLENIK